MSKYFNFKIKCSEIFDATVIYKYTCSVDQKIFFIAVTERQLFRRLTDLKGKDKRRVMLDYLFNCKHCLYSNIKNYFEF